MDVSSDGDGCLSSHCRALAFRRARDRSAKGRQGIMKHPVSKYVKKYGLLYVLSANMD